VRGFGGRDGRRRETCAERRPSVDATEGRILSATPLPPAACDTFPKLLEHQRALRPDRPAIREKDYGI